MNKYSNVEHVLISLIKALNIPVTSQTITEEVRNHTDPDSLLCMSDILNQFNILNYAFNNVSPEQLLSVPTPFIVHTKRHAKDFGLITSFSDTHIIMDSRSISKNDFLNLYDGVLLVVEASETSGDVDYLKHKRYQLLASLRNPFAIGSLVLMLLLALGIYTPYFTTGNWPIFVLTFFKFAGLVSAILLLIQSIDANNPLIQKLCQSENNKDCNAILSSKAATVFEGLSWSEVGYFYFAGSFFTVLFNSQSLPVLQVLALLNIVSLPYTFYSIYYQAKVVKQWCMFCCTIQALLWLEFMPLVFNLKLPLAHPNFKELISLLICFLTPFIIWIWVKPFLLKAQKITPLNQQLNKFKYNIELFNKLAGDQPKYVQPDPSWSIVLGNTDNPEKIITMVSNPYCGPCSSAHKILEEVLLARKNLQVRFVFVFNDLESENDKRMVVARQLLALNAQKDKTLLMAALNDWYAKKHRGFDDWSAQYPAESNDHVKRQLQSHMDWINLAEIRGTPTILVNGKKLPYPYQIADLKYL